MREVVIRPYKIIVLTIFGVFLLTCCDQKVKSEINVDSKVSWEKKDEKLLRHVVLFKFKDTASKEEIKKAEIAFELLPTKIEAIRDFEWGLNNSPENLNKEFTHCYFITFDSEEDRETYLPHPDHKEFGGIIGPLIDDVLVIDYWAK